jgi:hypothetical protein
MSSIYPRRLLAQLNASNRRIYSSYTFSLFPISVSSLSLSLSYNFTACSYTTKLIYYRRYFSNIVFSQVVVIVGSGCSILPHLESALLARRHQSRLDTVGRRSYGS